MRSEELRERRISARLTIRELHDLSGVSESTISKIEHGHQEGSPLTLAKLENALGVDPCRDLLEAAKEARDELEDYQAPWMEALAEKLDAAIQKHEGR